MQTKLNRKHVKHSDKPLHTKIRSKIHFWTERGNLVKEYTEAEIMEIAAYFPTLKVHIAFGGDIFIKSACDSWRIHEEDYFFTLFHYGINRHSTRVVTESWHVQDVYTTIEFIFASIVAHDRHRFDGKDHCQYQIINEVGLYQKYQQSIHEMTLAE